MRTNLQNPFYFIKDGIIFNIQGSNTEKDECGKHYKTFDTESVELKKGTYYNDKNGNVKIAEDDGTFEVGLKTDKKPETIAANKAVFPYFDVTYHYVQSGNEETVTYWLDDLITDGDKISNNNGAVELTTRTVSNSVRFVNKIVHGTEGDYEISYVEYYKNKCLDKLANDVINGMSLEQLAKNNPLIIVNTKTNPLIKEDTEIKFNGAKAFVVSSDISCTNDEIVAYLLGKIKEYGDTKVLKIFDEKCEVKLWQQLEP